MCSFVHMRVLALCVNYTFAFVRTLCVYNCGWRRRTAMWWFLKGLAPLCRFSVWWETPVSLMPFLNIEIFPSSFLDLKTGSGYRALNEDSGISCCTPASIVQITAMQSDKNQSSSWCYVQANQTKVTWIIISWLNRRVTEVGLMPDVKMLSN